MKTRELQKAQGRTEFQNSLRQFFRHSLLIFEMSRHKPSDMPKSHKNHKNKPFLTSTLPAQVKWSIGCDIFITQVVTSDWLIYSGRAIAACMR